MGVFWGYRISEGSLWDALGVKYKREVSVGVSWGTE